MKIIFISNYYNHHQKAFCESVYSKTKEKFRFISTGRMGREREALGYGSDESPEFVESILLNDEEKNKCLQLIDDADVVIVGSCPEEYIKNKVSNNGMIFYYKERLYKQGFKLYKWPIRMIKNYLRYAFNKKQYLLCASAYTAADYAITNNFIDKAYKWGYFPETLCYDPDTLMNKKNRKEILWCGRFIDWKHPEDVIKIAKRLKEEGYDFKINCIGTGNLDDELKNLIHEYNLESTINMLGSMKPSQVRSYMEKAGIYLFTSDFQEGWGAVLNESMNSGCAVVASHAIGAVPYLIKNGKNGIIYKYGDCNDMYFKVKYLLDNPDEQIRLGKAAYSSIIMEWNAEVASSRFLKLVEEIKDHGYCDLYEDGPCSKADIIKNDWFKG
ncbi:MAG: glycosyltransferase [Oscillospiraceae bacterium]|nr:glycosyltransferase [Oscillospiraceae bacterium]